MTLHSDTISTLPSRTLCKLSFALFVCCLVQFAGACATSPTQPDPSVAAKPNSDESSKSESTQTPPPDSKFITVENQTYHTSIEPGQGYEQRALLEHAQEMLAEKRLEDADEVLLEIIKNFQGFMEDTTAVYVSVANQKEYELIVKQVGSSKKVVWLDWALREAIHSRAFMAVGTGQYKIALELLNQEIKLAPFSASALCEKGFVLNKLREPEGAFNHYKKAFELSQNFESARPEAAPALRGMGFALIELGKLEEAEQVYTESLKIDPKSEIALRELDFIKKARAKQQQPAIQ